MHPGEVGTLHAKLRAILPKEPVLLAAQVAGQVGHAPLDIDEMGAPVLRARSGWRQRILTAAIGEVVDYGVAEPSAQHTNPGTH